MNPVLEVSKLSMNFGGLKAIENICLEIFQNEIVSLIGHNGAGKTTFFNCITGIYKPVSGDVFISPFPQKTEKERINGLKPNIITKKGMARTFQNIRLFQNITVLENVMIGRHVRTHAGIIASVLKLKKTRREEREIVEESFKILEKTGIEKFADEKASNLPYGAQRKLEIARALMARPRLLLLDEPSLGLAPIMVKQMFEIIKKINEENSTTVFLVEQNANLALKASSRGYVMENGKIIFSGPSKELIKNKKIKSAYLGL